jgi:hypothetical protein
MRRHRRGLADPKNYSEEIVYSIMVEELADGLHHFN